LHSKQTISKTIILKRAEYQLLHVVVVFSVECRLYGSGHL